MSNTTRSANAAPHSEKAVAVDPPQGAEPTSGAVLPPALLAALDAAAADLEPGRHRALLALATAAVRRVPDGDLELADPTALAARLLDAFHFADQREPGRAGLRVFAADGGLDGSADGGTVVEANADDAPFLLSTITEELRTRGLGILRTLHPIVGVERDEAGRIVALTPARGAAHRESFIHVQLDTTLGAEACEDLATTLSGLLADAQRAALDFPAMRAAVEGERERLTASAGTAYAKDEVDEASALLTWLLEENFVLLGTRSYEVVDVSGEDHVRIVSGSGLGILRDGATSRYLEPLPVGELEPELRERFLAGPLVQVSRTRRLSTVHRRARMEYVGLKHLDDAGRVVGEFRILGLFTKKAFAEPASSTPVLRRKLHAILDLEDVVEGSHDENAMLSLYQALPKDELFQSDVEQLHRTLVDLLNAEEQAETRVLVRVDGFTHTVSVLVSVPWERYSAQLREAIQELLLSAYDGERIDVDLSIGDRQEAIARFAVHTRTPTVPNVDPQELQAQIRGLARTWADDLTGVLIGRHGEAEGARLARTIGARLPASFRAATAPQRAAFDVEQLEDILRSGAAMQLAFVSDPDSAATGTTGPSTDSTTDSTTGTTTQRGPTTRVKVYLGGGDIELSSFLPVLESLGLTVVNEFPHVLGGDGPPLTIHDFGVRPSSGADIDVERDGSRIADAVLAAWTGGLEVDSLNRLVLAAGLTWSEVAILRAYRRYRRQAGTAYTPDYVNDALAQNPAAAAALIEAFHARFDPDRHDGEAEVAEADASVATTCDAVERLDHDRILRGFLALIDATLRTNFYRDDAQVLVLKLDSSRVPDLPAPVPYREIFVYSPAVEGIHLRGGAVARGGLRWSDRHDDFRTEVLGLMKAQVLKNAVIVPTGAKGGFTVKRAPADPDGLRAAVEDRYRSFIGGLLDVTDDIRDGSVVRPPRVRARDDDDPYLVVAADKGTATFSDTANAIAVNRGFWLGDAFASGGSQGYDHKALGITARGAWVSVQAHFRELGLDVQTEPFTVAGVGDMSGDVFGNGMLLSDRIRLVAAFDHRDIFLDPEPDPDASFAERERLFALPRSSWQDYDRELISHGGGVFSRSLKRIELTPEMRERLRLEADSATPDELIRAILQAPVDLLWAGGIGTYLRASDETDDQVGDRANDDVRISASDVRARVVAEGGNLFATQRARIQYARRGGRINTDAIDNSAGVDTSDHEVNVKILLGAAVVAGDLDAAERDALLADVTDEVVDHVLRDNRLQNWRLFAEAGSSARAIDTYEALMRTLEGHGLDRAVDNLPSTAEMHERADAGAGLTRPELAVLIGHAKRVLKQDLLDASLADDPATEPALLDYFPRTLTARFEEHARDHRLRRELIATVLANEVVNRLGIATVFRLSDETGSPRERVVAAYWTARSVADAEATWDCIENLGDVADPHRQLELERDVHALVEGLTRRYLHELTDGSPGGLIERDRPVLLELTEGLEKIGTEGQRRARRDAIGRLVDDLIEPDVAARLVAARDLTIVPEVATTQRAVGPGRSALDIADAFLVADDALGLARVRRLLEQVETPDRWARWQRAGLLADLRDLRVRVVRAAVAGATSGSESEVVAAYIEGRSEHIRRVTALLRDLEHADEVRLDAAAVALRTLGDAVRPRG